MPRDFIPNVDDANAEVIRLDGLLATALSGSTKATNDLEAANGLLTESQTEVTRLTGLNGTLTTDLANVRTELATAQGQVTAKDGQITQLNLDLAAAKGSANKTIAKAGVKPANEQGSTGDDNVDSQVTNLTGLQRAIAANQAAQAKQ